MEMFKVTNLTSWRVDTLLEPSMMCIGDCEIEPYVYESIYREKHECMQ